MNTSHCANLLSTPLGRRVLFAALYMSEGAPIGYIWWALPTRLRAEGLPVEQITALTSLLVLPWLLKFLWAPLIDTVRTRHWSLRSWILSMQFLMGATLLPLLFLDFQSERQTLIVFLLLHAVAAATQDAAIDAFAIANVPSNERGRTNGWMQVGMLVGRSVLGGGSLILASWLGQQGVVLLLVLFICSSSILLLIFREVPGSVAAQESIAARMLEFRQRLKEIIRQRSTWLGLIFAGIGGTAYEAVGAVAGPYLIDKGFATIEVGTFFAFPSVIGMVIGSIAGGYIADRVGKRNAVLFFLLLVVVTVWVLAGIDAASLSNGRVWTVVCLSALYIDIGLFTAGSYALLMDITDRRLGATQFSAYMGATNACESWSSYTIGRLIPLFGYSAGFAIMGLASLVAVPVLLMLPSGSHRSSRGEKAAVL